MSKKVLLVFLPVRSKPAVTPTGSKGSGSVGVTGGGGSGMRSGGGTVVRRGGKQGAQEREKTLLKEVDPARYSSLHVILPCC